MNKMRVDKWLWAVRIYKSRTQATEACKKGKVKLNDEILKPSALIETGQVIHLRKDKFNLIFKISQLIPNRVSARIASSCYANLTSQEELDKFKEFSDSAFYIATNYHISRRPTKKERREIDEFLVSDSKISTEEE
ncbi:MAG: RNA-binding S4 domain-containing protein [Saprospiraceae bacterium]|nr:RNA-binding S4 domain-containing protein [Saprospiraceae bacterium]